MLTKAGWEEILGENADRIVDGRIAIPFDEIEVEILSAAVLRFYLTRCGVRMTYKDVTVGDDFQVGDSAALSGIRGDFFISVRED